MNHYTDKTGFDGIRSQPNWRFLARQPRARHHPVGAYFTDYPPDEPHLAVKLFVPKEKLQFMFSFVERTGEFVPLPGGRGRLGHIFYSPVDYIVERERQRYHGETAGHTVETTDHDRRR